MKKYGKYEKMPDGTRAKQPPAKSLLLQTYFTSLLCLVLCVTMFFGTSYAWFTSEVTNNGNEIYIGVLDVELEKQNGTNWESLSSVTDGANITKLYSDAVRWEPGYTSLETVRVIDKGDLAFDYALTFTDGRMSGDAPAELQNAAKWFDVWVFDHQSETAYTAPASYKDITAASGWAKIGTLAEVLSGKNVFAGEMDEAAVTLEEEMTHTYTIALHMNSETINEDQNEALNALMGQKLELSVKLVATQKSSEKDGFGNSDYDKQETVIEITPENLASIDFLAEGNATYQLAGNFTSTYTFHLPAGANITVDGAHAEFDEGAVLIFNAPLDADSYSNAQGKERMGGYTFQNFKGNAALNFVGYNTTVTIKDNELSFLGLSLANVKANVIGNTIDAQNTKHTIWGNQNSDYGFYLYAADYDLVFSGNTVKNTNSHAVGINGRMDNPNWPGNGSNADTVAKNSVIFTGNTISDYKEEKAALKIWADTYYAQQKMTSEAELNENATSLIRHILAAESGNSITKPADGASVFNFYNYAFDNLNG